MLLIYLKSVSLAHSSYQALRQYIQLDWWALLTEVQYDWNGAHISLEKLFLYSNDHILIDGATLYLAFMPQIKMSSLSPVSVPDCLQVYSRFISSLSPHLCVDAVSLPTSLPVSSLNPFWSILHTAVAVCFLKQIISCLKSSLVILSFLD